jgi:SNF2 family DNA or RNA helicase
VEVKDNVKIKELLDEVAKDNKPVIVWATFQASILAIYCALADVYGKEQVARFDGSCTDDERLVGKERFLSGQARFFVGNPVVGGAGLTLNVANKTIYFGNSFKLIDRLQSEDRNHRIGQESSVLYIDLVCRGTTDEDVLAALKEKKGLTEYIKERLATDKQVLGEDGT